MAPGYKTLPQIAKAAGFQQQSMLTHTGGGMTGSARYKWEQENGIFQFAGKPQPKTARIDFQCRMGCHDVGTVLQ